MSLDIGEVFLILFAFSFLFFWVPPLVFAEESEEPQGMMDAFIDYTTNMIINNLENSELDDNTKQGTIQITEQGGEGGKKAWDLWTWLHEALVDGILWLTGGHLDKGIALLISFVVGTIILILAAWKIKGHLWKIGLAVFAVVAIIWILPIHTIGI